MLLRLALRNLSRHRRRTILTSITIAVSIAAYISFSSLFSGIEQESIRNMVKYETGQLTVNATGYWPEREELPLDHTIANAGAAAAAIHKVDGVRGATPRVVFSAALNNGTDEMPIPVAGVDPGTVGQVLALRETVTKGRFITAGRDEAMLGTQLAKLMDLTLGDQFTLVMQTQRSSFEAIDVTLVGLLDSPTPTINSGMVFIPLDVAQKAVRLPGGATEILVSSAGNMNAAPALAASVQDALRSSGTRAEVHTWRDSAEDMLAMIKSKQSSSGLLSLIVVVVAAIGVINSIVLASIERVREIGTLKAMGMTEREIELLFMYEGTGLGLIGGGLGALLGGAYSFYLATVGLDFSKVLGDTNIGFSITSVMHGSFSWATILGSFFAAVLASFFISYWPARLAARLNPTAALRS